MAAMLYFAAVFVNCLLFAPVVKATTRESLFSDTGLDNVIFTSSVLFESESHSVLDCGHQCVRDERCVTFTHVAGSSSGSCRGHSDTFTSTSDHDPSVTGAKTFTKPAVLPEGCTNYKVLDDVRRDANYTATNDLTDEGLQPGWYRFLLNGTNAVMPTFFVPVLHCGTGGSMWLDLNDASLLDIGQQLITSACYGSLSSNTCDSSSFTAVTVLNCLGFFLYFLNPTPAGIACGYCATSEK